MAGFRAAMPILCVTGFGFGIVAVSSAATAASVAARTVTVHIDGINRAGKVVAATGITLAGTEGFPIQAERSAKVAPQTYLIGAEIPTYGAGNQVVSESLVVNSVRVRASGTIKLNAQHGRRLVVALSGAKATEQALTASACMQTGGAAAPEAASGGPGVPVYVVAMKSARVRFSYLSDLQGAGGISYNLLGSAAGGLPSRPSYRQAAARLARVDIVLRGGADQTADSYLTVQPGNNAPCGYATEFGGSNSGPFSAVDYRTAGTWSTSVQTSAAQSNAGAYLYEARHYAAGKSYSDVYGAAVVGPRGTFPAIEGNIFNFNVAGLFADPNSLLYGDAGGSSTQIALRFAGRTLRKRTLLSSCQSQTCLQVTLHRSGWYALDLSSHRLASGGLLSSRVTLAWRFHVSPKPPAGNWADFPVTETVFRPTGLSLANQAPASGRTTVDVSIERAGEQFSPAPRYRLKRVSVEVSVNGGKTWQKLAIKKHGRSWLATVHDPASGYVALRSVVTDVKGDSTVQTIYQAYSIAS
jgi:hypothetical protein